MKLILFFLILASNQHVGTALVNDWVSTVDKDVAASIDIALVGCESMENPKRFRKCVKKATRSFVKDGTLSKSNVKAIRKGLWSGCPSEMPVGGTCRKSQKELQCQYYHMVVPAMDEDGVCTGETDCIATSGCNCMTDPQEWACWAARRRLGFMVCEGDVPKDAFTPCTP
jgi:hypothetical protein